MTTTSALERVSPESVCGLVSVAPATKTTSVARSTAILAVMAYAVSSLSASVPGMTNCMTFTPWGPSVTRIGGMPPSGGMSRVN